MRRLQTHPTVSGQFFRVRKLLKEQGLPESDYIISRKGVYCWTPEIPYHCDCISFEEKAEHALKQAEDFGKTELEEAVRLYRGEFCRHWEHQNG